VRHLLAKLIPPNPNASSQQNDDTCKRLLWVLFYLLKTIKKSLKNNDNSYAIVIQLTKEILRHHTTMLETFLGEGNKFNIPESAFQEARH
jgi:hypothetical protein